MQKVGIVILNYNNWYLTGLTLQSLCSAKHQAPFRVMLLDNGSEKRDAQSMEEIYRQVKGRLDITFIRNPKNAGFAGGNNIAIRRLLEDKEITHVCLLNSDVIVTDGWLDRLLAAGKDIIAPVCNATGNEQTVPVDYTVQKDETAIATVNAFAQDFYRERSQWLAESELLYFFAVLFSREVIDTVGLLDERFFPGSFEDNDYCMRILRAGFKMHIHRGVYIHHFGSGSFEKLDFSQRLTISQKNRELFEQKWNVKWEGDTSKLLLSFYQDVDALLTDSQHAEFDPYLELHYDKLQHIIRHLADENRKLAASLAQTQMQLQAAANRGSIGKLIKRLGKAGAGKLHTLARFLKFFRNPQYREALRKCRKKNAVLIFAPYFSDERLNDGYFKRIKAIDDLLAGYEKIYLSTEIAEFNLVFGHPREDTTVIQYNPLSKRHKVYLSRMIRACGRVYVHSVLRSEDWVFGIRGAKVFLDVHGVVPEEFVYCDDTRSAQLFGDKEETAIRNAAGIICVTRAMARYLEQKYQDPTIGERAIILPIHDPNMQFDEGALQEKPYAEGRPIVVYAGGTQNWQNIPQMQEAIYAQRKNAVFRMCVPSPIDFWASWKYERLRNMAVESKSYEDLCKVYRQSHYGFVLRDDHVLNRVACPTKINEYLQFGVIPILGYEDIGDFKEMGLTYISLEDFVQNRILPEAERTAAAAGNRKVLERYIRQCEEGERTLKERIDG